MVSTEVAGKIAPGESGTMAAMVAVDVAGPVAVDGGERLGTAPGPDAARPATRIVPLLAAAVACLGLAAMLVSGKLVEIAERQPLGETRDWWLGLATDVDRAANFLSLNRPYDLILDVRGVGTDAGRQVDSIEAVAAAAGIDPDASAVEAAGGEGGEGGAGAVGSAPDPPGAPAGPDPSDDPPVVDSPGTDPEGGDPPITDPPEPGPEGADPPEPGPEVTDPPEAGPDGADPSDPGPEGGDPPVTDPPEAGPDGVDPSDVDPGGGDPSGPGSIVTGPPGADPSSGETSGTASAPAGRTVTPEAPLRTYVAGDSQATFLGHALYSGRVRDLLEITRGDRIATSLARPDYFNWPAEAQKVAETDDPELIVFFLGANDWQDMVSGEDARLRRGTEEWRQEWGWRLFVTLEVLKSEHRHVVWVGQPPMRSDPFREGAPVLNEIAREVIAGRDDATMIDIWEMFGGDGEYREQVIGPDGEEFRARQNDGVHLHREASEWVADLVVDVIARRWDLQLE